MNQNFVPMPSKDEPGYWVCPGYSVEICIFSDGSVVPCCQDPNGINTIGNCNDTPVLELWKTEMPKWHADNVAASQEGRAWKSEVCFESCFKDNRLMQFGIKNNGSTVEFEKFKHQIPRYPFAMVIEPIAMCNYKCHYCASGPGKLPRIDKTLSSNVLEEKIAPILKYLQKVRLYNYGEPFLHPEIKEIIRIIRESAPSVEIEISTNAILMTEDIIEVLIKNQVNRLIVSVHGGHTQEYLARFATDTLDGDYEQTEMKVSSMSFGPDIGTVEVNIEKLVKAKREMNKFLPWISVKTLLGSWNDTSSYMDDFLLWGRRLGVDFAGFGMAFTHGFGSKRFSPGTPLWDCIGKRKLNEADFHGLFPAWPMSNFKPSVPVGGLPLEKLDNLIWYDDGVEE